MVVEIKNERFWKTAILKMRTDRVDRLILIYTVVPTRYPVPSCRICLFLYINWLCPTTPFIAGVIRFVNETFAEKNRQRKRKTLPATTKINKTMKRYKRRSVRLLKNGPLKNDNYYNEFKNGCIFNRPTRRFNIHIFLQMLRTTTNGITPTV